MFYDSEQNRFCFCMVIVEFVFININLAPKYKQNINIV